MRKIGSWRRVEEDFLCQKPTKEYICISIFPYRIWMGTYSRSSIFKHYQNKTEIPQNHSFVVVKKIGKTKLN